MRLLPIAASIGAVVVDCHFARGDSLFNPSSGSGYWTLAGNWSPSGVPGATAVADFFKTSSLCIYNVSAGTSQDLSAVQIADGAILDFTTSASSNSTLETTAFEIGGTYTGVSGRTASTGAGTVSQLAGFVSIDPGGVLAVDPSSLYGMSGSATLTALGGANEMLAGVFNFSGGTNQVYAGGAIVNSGTFQTQNSSAGTIMCDTYINTGTFNQAGATLEAYTNGSNGSFNFNNSGTYFYSLGSFLGVMNNSGSVQVNGAAIPFGKGIVNNGLLTVNGSTGTYSGVISGNGSSASIVFKGATNVTIAGSDAYYGLATVTAGTVTLTAPTGVAANNFGSALQGNVSISAAGTLALGAADQISNTSTLTINGGTFNLNNFDESVGSLIMDAGTVQEVNLGIGLGVTSGQITIGKGSATINGGLRSANTLNFNVSTGNTVTVNGAMGSYNSVGQALALTGGGTLYFSGASNLSTITVNSGFLQVAEGGTLGGSNTALTVQSGGSLELNNQTLTIGDLFGSSAGAVSLGTGMLTISSTTGSTFPGTINGTGSLLKSGVGKLVISGVDSSTGSTDVSQGILTLASSGSIASSTISVGSLSTLNLNGTIAVLPVINVTGTLNFGANPGSGILTRSIGSLTLGTNTSATGQANVAPASPHTNRTLLITGALSFSGTTGGWVGQLDLTNNDMIVQNGSMVNLTSEAASGYNASAGGTWNGQGIASSVAAADTTHLTALAVVLNDIGGGTPLYGLSTNLGLFDGYNPSATDVLVKFTYYGDANLDGQVDGSDYARIDNGAANQLTGWFNGDFNYDGIINGSDYTLIDNAFNTQGVNLTSSAQVAAITTAQIASNASVPEPTTMGIVATGIGLLLSRRRARFQLTTVR